VTLPASAQRVVDAATEAGLQIDVVEFPDGTRTAEDAARAVGVEVGQIVKSLVFAVNGETVLALVSGVNRLDERALARASGSDAAEVGRLDADAVREATGFAVGGVPPFGHRTPLATFVDRDLLVYSTVWAAAGTPRHVFSTTAGALVRVTGATVADLREAR
jgi:prolyl-tRNA editing enzyme YbaK/EbsC (Cys-tRNA(Pro) deacylase)